MNKIYHEANTIELFSSYMKVFGTPHVKNEQKGDNVLSGKTLGLINGATWISLWTNYFGSKIIPGVQLINVCNDAIQMNFIKAYNEDKECPPQINKDLFVEYAVQLHSLVGVDAILITCSTMNRSYHLVRDEMDKYQVPVIQIDMPMMEKAVDLGEKILIIATHGPTIENSKLLLNETADAKKKTVSIFESNILEAFDLLDKGDVIGHNNLIADSILLAKDKDEIDVVVLAQLSMAAFKLSYPNCEEYFGVPVLTSAECGFHKIKELLTVNKN